MKGKNVRNPLDVRIEADRQALRGDMWLLFIHLVVLLAMSGVSVYLFHKAGFPTPGLVVGGLLSGPYFTQILWCNFKRSPIRRYCPLERRSKGRPWINGSLLVFICTVALSLTVTKTEFAIAYISGLLVCNFTALLWAAFHYMNLWINGNWWERVIWRFRHNIRSRRSY